MVAEANVAELAFDLATSSLWNAVVLGVMLRASCKPFTPVIAPLIGLLLPSWILVYLKLTLSCFGLPCLPHRAVNVLAHNIAKWSLDCFCKNLMLGDSLPPFVVSDVVAWNLL